MSAKRRILVLGGGIVGLSAAVWLLRDGHDVVIVDKEAPGRGDRASFGNAGIFANYATLPLASKATLRGLPRELGDRQGALSVRPHYWPRMTGFGLSFLKAAGSATFERNRRTLTGLVQAAEPAFVETLRMAGADDLLVHNGCLAVYRHRAGWDAVRETQLPLRRADGVEVHELSAEEIVDLEPALRSGGLVGGAFYPQTMHVRHPNTVMQRMFGHFIAAGGRFVRGNIADIAPREDGGVDVATDTGRLGGDAAVVTLGFFSRPFLERLGLRLPLVSERGYHVTVAEESVRLNRPVGWLKYYFYATPMAGGVRLAGTTEFANPDSNVTERRWRLMREWGRTLFGPKIAFTSEWHGTRASTPDTLPLLGRLPKHRNLFVATGHGHLGLTLSGISGRLVAELVAGRRPSHDIDPLRPDRF